MKQGNEAYFMERAIPDDGQDLLQLIEADASKGVCRLFTPGGQILSNHSHWKMQRQALL